MESQERKPEDRKAEDRVTLRDLDAEIAPVGGSGKITIGVGDVALRGAIQPTSPNAADVRGGQVPEARIALARRIGFEVDVHD